MSNTPESIWINKIYGQHPEDWDFTDGKHLTKAQLAQKVEYVHIDRLKEIEYRLIKSIDIADEYAYAAGKWIDSEIDYEEFYSWKEELTNETSV